jgi:hypothetical protein
MIFLETEPDENFPLRKFLSEGGRWELGLTPMMFGVRVRLGVAGNPWCTLDYCAGPKPADQFFLLGIVAGICFWLAEETSEIDLQRVFPRQTIKPMSEDKECFQSLLELGEKLSISGRAAKGSKRATVRK